MQTKIYHSLLSNPTVSSICPFIKDTTNNVLTPICVIGKVFLKFI